MTPLLEQLDRESMLLMYAADELSLEDRLEVERRVAADAALAAALAEIQQLNALCDGALTSEDKQTRLPMSADTAMRRMSRVMKQWQTDQAHRKAMAPVAPHRFRLPIWSYPGAVAAAVIVAALVWARMLPDAGERVLSADEIAAMHQKTTDELSRDWYNQFREELESESLLARMDSQQEQEEFVNDVFMRSGG
jgi:anti-sigma factor RsiW